MNEFISANSTYSNNIANDLSNDKKNSQINGTKQQQYDTDEETNKLLDNSLNENNSSTDEQKHKNDVDEELHSHDDESKQQKGKESQY